MLCFKCTAEWFSYISIEFRLSVVPDSLQPHGLQNARLPCPSPTPDLAQTYVNRVSDAIQPSHSLSSPSPTFNLSQHEGLFQWVSSSHQVAKLLELQLQYQSFQWIFRLISFRMDWLNLLAAQGTLKSLLQYHSSKASILWHSAFLIVQLSHPYMTPGKTIALTRWTFVGQVMFLLNILSWLVIAFLPRSKCLLISWLQSPSAVILEPQRIKSLTVSLFHHLFAMKWWGQMPWSSFFESWVLSQLFHSPLSLSTRGSLVLLCFLP